MDMLFKNYGSNSKL